MKRLYQLRSRRYHTGTTRNRSRMRCTLFLAFLLAIPTVARAQDTKDTKTVTLHVSPDGDDGWSGKLAQPNSAKTDGPVATLTKARELVRIARHFGPGSEPPITIALAAGTYFLDKPVEFTAADSGSAVAPLLIEGTGSVRLLGGRRITGFLPVTDPAIQARLAPAAREKVVVADLAAQGITDFGQLKSRGFSRPQTPAALELFFNDQPMTLARWPNAGKDGLVNFVKIAAIPKDQAAGDEHGGKLGKLEGGFHYDGDRPSSWKDPSDIWVHGYWAWDWANSYERIDSLDTANRLIKTAPPYGLYGFRAGQRIFFLNILEELDQAGEWYLDRKAGLLYFWPPQPIESGQCLLSMVEQPLISFTDVSHVTLRNLAIECARGTGIGITGGNQIIISDCTLRNLGNYGVTVRGGMDHLVDACTIYQTGDGGIELAGGDRKTLAPAGHAATNNHIHHVATWSKCYVPAILIEGVGIRADHNLIHDHSHCPILFTGNDHVIEFNEIHHVCLETGDVGAIYTGRDYTFRGNVIRYNYIHETGGVGMGSMGIYNDDNVSGTVMAGNIFYKVQRAVFLGGGRDFRVENNVFIDCNPAISLDARGLDKRPVWHNMVYDTLKKRLEAMNYEQPPYSTRYPELLKLKPLYEKDDGIPPAKILIAHNICVGGKWLQIHWNAKPEMVTLKDNLTDQDPHFVDPEHGNFQLKDDSPAFRLGFERIPTEQIGPRKHPRSQ